MTKSPSDQSSTISIIVIDAPKNNFNVNIQVKTETNSSNECTIKMNNRAFKKLMDGETTFEIEAGNDNIEISGNTNLLRHFGKSLRNSN